MTAFPLILQWNFKTISSFCEVLKTKGNFSQCKINLLLRSAPGWKCQLPEILARLLKARDKPKRGFLSPKVPSETFYSLDVCQNNKTNQYEVITSSSTKSKKLLVWPGPAWQRPPTAWRHSGLSGSSNPSCFLFISGQMKRDSCKVLQIVPSRNRGDFFRKK